MCMSNLPIEFDEQGDPYLAEEAEDVDQPTCGCGEEVALAELNPEDAFADIADTVPDDVLEHLEGGPEEAEPVAVDAADPEESTDAAESPAPTGGD